MYFHGLLLLVLSIALLTETDVEPLLCALRALYVYSYPNHYLQKKST